MSFCEGIEVRVLQARRVRKISFLDKNDLFVTLEIGAQTEKTSVKNNAGDTATWNESFTFAKSQIAVTDTLRVRIWDYDFASPNDKIGGTIIQLKSIVDAGGSLEQFFVLYRNKMGGKTAGEVKLGIRLLQPKRVSAGKAGQALFRFAMAVPPAIAVPSAPAMAVAVAVAVAATPAIAVVSPAAVQAQQQMAMQQQQMAMQRQQMELQRQKQQIELQRQQQQMEMQQQQQQMEMQRLQLLQDQHQHQRRRSHSSSSSSSSPSSSSSDSDSDGGKKKKKEKKKHKKTKGIGVVLTPKGSENYANCGGTYCEAPKVKLNGKPVYVRVVGDGQAWAGGGRFIGWTGQGWTLTSMGYFVDICSGKIKSPFGGFHSTPGGSILDSKWDKYKVSRAAKYVVPDLEQR